MALSPEGRRRRARAAALRRHHPDDPEAGADDRRTLKADAAERYVRQLVDSFPPLSAEQKSRLTLILHGAEVP